MSKHALKQHGVPTRGDQHHSQDCCKPMKKACGGVVHKPAKMNCGGMAKKGGKK